LLVDDFEDGDFASFLGPDWSSYDDSQDSGASTITLEVVADGYESSGALSATFALDQGDFEFEPYVGWDVGIGSSDAPFDASPYAGLSYMHKGAAHSTRLAIFAVRDYDFHAVSVEASDDWVLVELPLEDFEQADWGQTVKFNPADISLLSIQVMGATGDAGNVMIDNVQFYAQ
jgi:endoglucanase